MTKDDALNLIKQYERLLSSGSIDPTLTQISSRWPEDGSTEKAMRWLGFMQGAAYALRVCSLDELREHSRTGRVE